MLDLCPLAIDSLNQDEKVCVGDDLQRALGDNVRYFYLNLFGTEVFRDC